MILNTLVSYYDRLEADPECDIAPFGFSRQKISGVVVVQPDGTLFEFQDVRRKDGDRVLPALVIVMGQAKPTGSGINPCFLWDNAQYALGFKPEDPKPARTTKAFEAFRKRHLAAEKEIDDEGFSAVCRFLESWDPNDANRHPALADVAEAFMAFRIQGAREYVHERPKVREYWLRTLQPDEDAGVPMASSLVTGEMQPIARLHEPAIKGVVGAQTAGAKLIGFNHDAFESYGKSQSFNAPVGVSDAFKYCTALNRLLADDRHRVRIAGDTIVFWADRATTFEDDFGPALADTYTDDQETLDRTKAFWNRVRQARAGDTLEDAAVPFYVLCLSPNASRLSVRFWLVGTVQQFAERLGQHAADLELGDAPPDAPPLTIQRILDQTARERKDITKPLEGAMIRSVLTGTPYPTTLCTSVLRRIRADGRVTHPRAAILKAYIVRKTRSAGKQQENLVSLDTNHPNQSYHLGRLFAALEKTQEEAYDNKLNSTVKDRFFSSASANPVAAFPRLMRLHSHHLEKIEYRGRQINLERLVQEVIAQIDGFPAHLSLDDQGLFFIGYYHQRQDFFTPKTDSNNDSNSTEAN